MSKKFTATMERDETSLFIELPFDVKAEFGKARAPVIVSVNGYRFSTRVMVYGGKSFVGLRREIRQAAKVGEGDRVKVEIALDVAERKVEVPAVLQAALAKNAEARNAWNSLSFTHQREHADAIVKAKKAATAQRRVATAVKMLLEKK